MLKKAMLLALLLALLGAARAEGALCVVTPQLTALTDASGDVLLSGEGIADVFCVREGALYAAGSRGAYRLYDAAGVPVGEAVFGMIDDAGDALVYRVGRRYGAMDADGAVLLEPEWTQLTPDGAGGWLALDGDPLDDSADEILHIDAAGEVRRSGVYTASGLLPVRCGCMPYRTAEGLWGAVDASGRVAVNPAWHALGGYEDGLAKATGPDGTGVIDVNGRVVVATVYRWLERSPAMIAALGANGLDVYAPDGGERLFSLPGGDVDVCLAGGMLAVSDDTGTRLYDAEGKMLYEGGPGVTFAEGCMGQLIACDGAWGEACQWLMNPDGSAASARVQQLLPLSGERYAFLELDGTEYYSAELGRIQTSWDYAHMRYGLMDSLGNILIPTRFREIRSLGGDRLLLLSEGETVLSDMDGTALKRWVTAQTEAPTGEAGE